MHVELGFFFLKQLIKHVAKSIEAQNFPQMLGDMHREACLDPISIHKTSFFFFTKNWKNQ